MRLSIPRTISAVAFLVFAALAFFATVSTPAAAGPLEDALTAVGSGDYATALRLCRPLAERGNARAQYLLGEMYANGQGVKQDYAQAARWYRKAADQGNADAQLNLGRLHAFGWVKQDYVQAYKWFSLAASRHPEAGMRLYSVGMLAVIAKKMTPAQMTKAEKLAREWKPK